MQFPAEILENFLLEIEIPHRTIGFVHLWVKITPQTCSSLNKVPFWLSSDSSLTSHMSLLATNNQQFPKNQTLQLLCWPEKLVTSTWNNRKKWAGSNLHYFLIIELQTGNYSQHWKRQCTQNLYFFSKWFIYGGEKGMNLWRIIVKNFRKHSWCKSCL